MSTIGTAPRWAGGNLAGTERLLYTAAYVVGLWCWVFAFVGAAVRFLSTLIFFITLLKPFDWHWSITLAISVGGSMPIPLLTYHWFVRFTWIGAMLNGRRHPRPEKPPPPPPSLRKAGVCQGPALRPWHSVCITLSLTK